MGLSHQSIGTHVPHKLVVIVLHMEEQPRDSLLAGRHPPPLPRPKHLDLATHGLRARQSLPPGQEVAEPTCL
jgi:hypothetical protein